MTLSPTEMHLVERRQDIYCLPTQWALTGPLKKARWAAYGPHLLSIVTLVQITLTELPHHVKTLIDDIFEMYLPFCLLEIQLHQDSSLRIGGYALVTITTRLPWSHRAK
ncbi:hypothetical protein TNCV_4108651 [Trichonephila clavipes]|nr:hypothetical protein TNCV_4108651 [Trichonephila clavipes]